MPSTTTTLPNPLAQALSTAGNPLAQVPAMSPAETFRWINSIPEMTNTTTAPVYRRSTSKAVARGDDPNNGFGKWFKKMDQSFPPAQAVNKPKRKRSLAVDKAVVEEHPVEAT